MAVTRITSQTTLAAFGGASVTGTYPKVPTPGNLLIITAAYNTSSVNATNIGWTKATDVQCGNASQSLAVFYKIAGANEATSVTVGAAGASSIYINMHEFQGVSPRSPFDQVVTTTGSATPGTTMATGTLTTADDPVLFFAAVGGSNFISSVSWSNGFSLITSDGNIFAEAILSGPSGAISTTASWTSSVVSSTTILSFNGLGSEPTNSGRYVRVGDGISRSEMTN